MKNLLPISLQSLLPGSHDPNTTKKEKKKKRKKLLLHVFLYEIMIYILISPSLLYKK